METKTVKPKITAAEKRSSLFLASDALRVADDVLFAADEFSDDHRNSFIAQVIEYLQNARTDDRG